jgi:hypothetical protein
MKYIMNALVRAGLTIKTKKVEIDFRVSDSFSGPASVRTVGGGYLVKVSTNGADQDDEHFVMLSFDGEGTLASVGVCNIVDWAE